MNKFSLRFSVSRWQRAPLPFSDLNVSLEKSFDKNERKKVLIRWVSMYPMENTNSQTVCNRCYLANFLGFIFNSMQILRSICDVFNCTNTETWIEQNDRILCKYFWFRHKNGDGASFSSFENICYKIFHSMNFIFPIGWSSAAWCWCVFFVDSFKIHKNNISLNDEEHFIKIVMKSKLFVRFHQFKRHRIEFIARNIPMLAVRMYSGGTFSVFTLYS